MPITITTTTVVETLDDLTDALAALREISVDAMTVSGDIDFVALAESRIDRAHEALLAPHLTDEAMGSKLRAMLHDDEPSEAVRREVAALHDAADLTRRTLDQLETSERIGLLGDVWVETITRPGAGGLLDVVFLRSRRERIIEIAATGGDHSDQLCAGLVQGYFARDGRFAASVALIELVIALRAAAEAELTRTANRASAPDDLAHSRAMRDTCLTMLNDSYSNSLGQCEIGGHTVDARDLASHVEAVCMAPTTKVMRSSFSVGRFDAARRQAELLAITYPGLHVERAAGWLLDAGCQLIGLTTDA